jgi:DNA-binding NtrC family response regulator
MDRKLQVLIVEDHAGVRDVLERMVESWADVNLISCNGFLGATKWIHEADRIDLLLCDVCLPEGMSGIDLAKIAVQTHPQAAIVMTSADPRASVPRFSDRYGFVRKPYGRDALLKEIDRAFIELGVRDANGAVIGAQGR